MKIQPKSPILRRDRDHQWREAETPEERKRRLDRLFIEQWCCYHYSLVPRPSIFTGMDVCARIITSVHEEGLGNFCTVLRALRMYNTSCKAEMRGQGHKIKLDLAVIKININFYSKFIQFVVNEMQLWSPWAISML